MTASALDHELFLPAERYSDAIQIIQRLSNLAVEGCQDVASACSQLNTTLWEGTIVTAKWKGHEVQTQPFQSC